MAYDEKLAARIRRVLADRNNVSERMMFGGLAFTLGQHLYCGIVGSELMVGVGPEGHSVALAQKHCRPMDFTGKPLKGMVYVAPAGVKTAPMLRKWVARGVDFAESLPPKRPKRMTARGPKKRP